ncbi:6065_t:CDS:1, partial [Ambispora leptoticha]
YDTYRSTLTAYPDTLLGAMFADRNKATLHPTNGNEYFIDRNGRAFHYVLEFYRTGKNLWLDHTAATTFPNSSKHPQQDWTLPVSRKELEEEFNYFLIPGQSIGASLTHKVAAVKLDEFVMALKEVISTVVSCYGYEVTISFTMEDDEMEVTTDTDKTPHAFYNIPGRIRHFSKPSIDGILMGIMKPFQLSGYHIISMFGKDVERHIKSEMPELIFELFPDLGFYFIYMNFKNCYDHDAILRNSCLLGIDPAVEEEEDGVTVGGGKNGGGGSE